MPQGVMQLFQRVLPPVMGAGQTALGAATMNPLLMGTGALQLGQGLATDFAGNQQPTPAPTATPTQTATPIGEAAIPSFPTSAATGLSTVPGAGAGVGGGAGPATDMSSYANMIASNMMTNNPFAIYGG